MSYRGDAELRVLGATALTWWRATLQIKIAAEFIETTLLEQIAALLLAQATVWRIATGTFRKTALQNFLAGTAWRFPTAFEPKITADLVEATGTWRIATVQTKLATRVLR